jgi:hypothetical protein
MLTTQHSCGGPERAGPFGLRADVEVTAARNALNDVGTRTGSRSLSPSASAPGRACSRRRSHRRTPAICRRLSAGVGGVPVAVPRTRRPGHPRHRTRGARRGRAGAVCPVNGAVPRRQLRNGRKPLADFQRRQEAEGVELHRPRLTPRPSGTRPRQPGKGAADRGRDMFRRRPRRAQLAAWLVKT